MPQKSTIMLVEDDNEARELLAEVLEIEGFAVVGFPNGAEALAYLEHSDPPSLIILDMRMPVMDGPQFRSALLARPHLAKIPAVVVTAYDPAAAAQLSLQKVLKKPIDLNALLAVVRQYC